MSGRNTERIRLRFETPRAGWLAATLQIGRKVVRFIGSDTPRDWLVELVWSLDAVASGQSASATIFAEPTEYHVLMDRQREMVCVKVVSVELGGHSSTMLKATIPVDKLLMAFWRGLRELESRMAAGACQWRYPFPASELARLQEKLLQLYPKGSS